MSDYWDKMRSDIYIRDKGICWLCNAFVDLPDYDLGHLVDKCNDGQPTYDNLVVMHKHCNSIKPYHETLEEAVRWRLTYNMPVAPRSPRPSPKKRLPDGYTNIPKISAIERSKQAYELLKSKVVPCTICWVQGRPFALGSVLSPMWKVLPPPYRQEDLFSLRQTPPGATDNGQNGIKNTLQVINGVLGQDVNVSLGALVFHIHANDGNPFVTFTPSSVSNVGERSQTIGYGVGQIPVSEWQEAKRRGMSLSDFKTQYALSHSVATTGIGDGV